jgi:acylglycerol lipase
MEILDAIARVQRGRDGEYNRQVSFGDGWPAFNHGSGPLLIGVRLRRAALLLGILLAGCVGRLAPPGPVIETPVQTAGAFVLADGAALPYRQWLPRGEPWAVVLALHGMNDSRDAWEIPGPALAAAGIAVFAPDQRGFGDAPGRGLWPGSTGLVADAEQMTRLLRARYPKARHFLMGESMGAAILMLLATRPHPPPVDGYVLIAPAVWGRAEMNVFLRSALWLADLTVPGLTLSGAPVRVVASSNREALIRLSRDPLTIRRTRVDTIKGLVDLMDGALAAARRFRAPALFMYGGKDELIPARATVATWRALPGDETLAYYPQGYHLLLRDLDRSGPIGDVIAWMQNREAPLPSGADVAARHWLEQEGVEEPQLRPTRASVP